MSLFILATRKSAKRKTVLTHFLAASMKVIFSLSLQKTREGDGSLVFHLQKKGWCLQLFYEKNFRCVKLFDKKGVICLTIASYSFPENFIGKAWEVFEIEKKRKRLANFTILKCWFFVILFANIYAKVNCQLPLKLCQLHFHFPIFYFPFDLIYPISQIFVYIFFSIRLYLLLFDWIFYQFDPDQMEFSPIPLFWYVIVIWKSTNACFTIKIIWCALWERVEVKNFLYICSSFNGKKISSLFFSLRACVTAPY